MEDDGVQLNETKFYRSVDPFGTSCTLRSYYQSYSYLVSTDLFAGLVFEHEMTNDFIFANPTPFQEFCRNNCPFVRPTFIYCSGICGSDKDFIPFGFRLTIGFAIHVNPDEFLEDDLRPVIHSFENALASYCESQQRSYSLKKLALLQYLSKHVTTITLSKHSWDPCIEKCIDRWNNVLKKLYQRAKTDAEVLNKFL